MEVVILVGLQGAGKSTFYRSRFVATHQHISKDNFSNAANSDLRQSRLLEAALAENRSVVVDNTNASISERATIIAQAKSARARVIGYYFASQLKVCLSRNEGRTGKARVPDVALFATAKRLQLPSYSEGFDALFYVRATQDGAFVVEEWNEEESDFHG